jgi:uncharacterized membrane protein (DUF441 family)
MYYERLGSRSFYINRGLLLILPLFCLMLFMLSAANIAAPPTINLASEIFLIIRILSYDEFIILVFPVGSFLGAVFTLFMFSYSQHGSVYYASHSHSLINVRELHALASHVIPVNFLILKGDFYLILFCWSSLIKIKVCGTLDGISRLTIKVFNLISYYIGVMLLILRIISLVAGFKLWVGQEVYFLE